VLQGDRKHDKTASHPCNSQYAMVEQLPQSGPKRLAVIPHDTSEPPTADAPLPKLSQAGDGYK
jgi:hypothetical protein